MCRGDGERGGGSLTLAMWRLKGRHHAFNDTCGAAIEERCTRNRGNVVVGFFTTWKLDRRSEIATLMELVSIFTVRDKKTMTINETWLKCLQGY